MNPKNAAECPPVVADLYNAIRATLEADGVQHGKASVVQLPDGSWVMVAAPDPLPEPTPQPNEDSETGGGGGTFKPGGGGFGGGGASGSW